VSLDATDWVWGFSQSKGAARLVMLAIADRARGRECTAYASMTTLQRMANAGSRQTIITAVQSLTELGELEAVEGATGPYGATVYRLPKALGHVRRTRGSVQKLDRSAWSEPAQLGTETGPIEVEAFEQIGPVGESIGTETGPIGPRGTGPETGPIEQPRTVIGPVFESETPQHGPKTGPQNKELNQLQEQIYIPGAPVVAAKPKRRRAADANDRTPVEPVAFAAFWTAYPKKDAKPDAIKAWNAAITELGGDPKTLIDGAARYRAWDGRDPRYTKNPATWLNKDCWENPYEPVGRAGHQSYQNPASDDEYEGDL
jgi:hypothetical protein